MWRKLSIALGLTVLLVLIGIIYLTKPIIHSFATDAFKSAGCKELSFTEIQFGLGKLHVDRLTCYFQQGDLEFQADTHNTSIDFPWQKLLLNKQAREIPISRLLIERANIEFPKERIILPELEIDLDLSKVREKQILLGIALRQSEATKPVWKDEKGGLQVFLEDATSFKVDIRLDESKELKDIHVFDTGLVRVGVQGAGLPVRVLLSIDRLSLVGDILGAAIKLNAFNSYAPMIPINITGNVDSLDLNVLAKGKLTEFTASNSMEYQKYLPENFELLSAEPSIDAQIQFEKGILQSGFLHVVLEKLSANYKETEIPNAKIDLRTNIWSRKNRLRFKPHLNIELESFDPGVKLEAIRLRAVTSAFAQSPTWIDLKEFSAKLFGGSLEAKPKKLDLSKKFQTLNIAFKDLSLAEIVKLDTKDRVKGNGTLDGEVPILITKEGFAIDNGNLKARSPGGSLQYRDETSAAVAQSNENLNIALKALENFEFNHLESGVTYEPDGKLVFALRLQGRNPNLYDGKPVHFNINVEQNVLQLLKSLQIAEELDKSIDRKFSK